MIETNKNIPTPDGEMNTFIVHPDEEGPHPVILFLMDAPGKREELHDMARRIATTGYFVLLPDLYYRVAPGFKIDGSKESRETMYKHMSTLKNSMIVNDCKIMLDHALNNSAAKTGPAGCVGYCMSGPFAFAAAAHLGDRIKASASFHGVSLFTDQDDSPHLDANKINGEIYFGYAETDEHAPQAMIDNLQDYLSKTSINYRLELYPKTGHGFVFPKRTGFFHKPSAEKHWQRLLSLFDRNLKFN
tara:strand:+ start:278 stop:1012 length:735 start_codon:yes stop_codon:yes gene_type:complete